MRPYTKDSKDYDDIFRWPPVIAAISTDMAQPYWPEFGMRDLADSSVLSAAREFVLAWKKLDGTNVSAYRKGLIELFDSLFASASPIFFVLDQIVHEPGFRDRNLSAELAAWEDALCSGGSHLHILQPGESGCQAAVHEWCARTSRQSPLVHEIFSELKPETPWDRWLCSPEGFYGDDEFLANVELGRIAEWRIFKNLQEAVRSACSSSETAALLALAAAAIDPDIHEQLTLEI
jgi:hypothetical protein